MYFDSFKDVKAKLIETIRTDEKIGRGSCSMHDECMEDEELVDAFLDFAAKALEEQIKPYLMLCRECEEIRRERDNDILNA